MRKIVERLLRQAGIELEKVVEAANGAEALAALQSNGVDLILCDIHMPVMDGLEFVRQIATVETAKGVDIVMLGNAWTVTPIAQAETPVATKTRKPSPAAVLKRMVVKSVDPRLQPSFHPECVFDGNSRIRRDFLEPHPAIECDRILHCRCNRIQTHALIAYDARLRDYAFYKHPAQASAAIGRPHVQPLHFADTGFQSAQCNASGGVACVPGKQQSPARRDVGAGKAFQLLIETLEAQAEAERTAIFEKEAASLFDVFGDSGLNQFDLAPIVLTRNVLNRIAFAVSGDGHWRP